LFILFILSKSGFSKEGQVTDYENAGKALQQITEPNQPKDRSTPVLWACLVYPRLGNITIGYGFRRLKI
jgi:hypothetical protein